MLKDVTECRALDDYQVHLRFEDGVEGGVDIRALLTFDGVFAPLSNPDYFARVAVNAEVGTICWPNGADIDPDVLYAQVTGEALPTFPDPSTTEPRP